MEKTKNNSVTIQSVLEKFSSLTPNQQQRFNSLLDSIIPKRFHNKKLLTVVPENIVNHVINSINSLFGSNPYGVFLQGGVGVGKTCTLYLIYRIYLMYCYTNICTIEEPILINQILWNIKFTTHFDLVKSLREIASEDEDINLKLLNSTTTPILIIDDLGRGYNDKAGWNRSLLSEFIDYRWSNGLTTYFSSNRTKPELNSIFSPEAIDRLFDPAWVHHLPFEGESFRNNRNQNK